MLNHCTSGNIDEAYKVMAHLWRMGYSAVDIITNIFRVCKTMEMAEYLKLEYIKVHLICLYISMDVIFIVHLIKESVFLFRTIGTILLLLYCHGLWQKVVNL